MGGEMLLPMMEMLLTIIPKVLLLFPNPAVR
jgi:hypothetical protein